MKVVCLRSRFITKPSQEEEAKGWLQEQFYDIKVKQEGEKFLVKKAEDHTRETMLEFNNFHEFTECFTVHFKYIN